MLKRFIKYYKPTKNLFVLDMIASVIFAAIGVIYPVVTRMMLNDLIPNRKYSMIIIAGASVLVLYLIRFGLKYVSIYYGHIMGVRMQAQMRRDLFSHLERLPFSFYDDHETGKIMSRLTTDLFEMAELAHHGPENVIVSAVSLIFAFIYLGTINIWLTLIVFSCVPLLLIVMLRIKKRVEEAYARSREAIAGINAAIESSISGIRVTKAFNNSAIEEEKFDGYNREFVEANDEKYRAMAEYHSSSVFITDIFNVVVLIAGGLFLYDGKISFADYSAFIVSVNLFINPITTLINFMEQYQSGVSGFKRFLEIMDVEPEADKAEAVDVERFEGHVEFRNVSYGYDEGKDVLKHIDMDIKPGETYALVGPSGGGKTTVCHLIPHFYNVESGSILIDGKNISEITMESLRRNIGIVQQDIFLFNSSVRDNILYGRPDASDEEVIEAAKKANIHEYIMSMPEGYDTVIGERGIKLSGGQKQRLCIARVFLKNPPILILDEATSALDNATEIYIQQALDELSKGRTTLVVAHRLSTIRNADRIAVINKGRIIEQGTHDELLSKNGEYSELYRMQFRDQ
ncbi:MAG: ABC transporter ATP-binding protein [Eubacteriales bacterium]|nr:ABC transporter ATP-binding protein [Eubacteriales bacterium]